jgi:plasmid stabilization system protein ParE
VGQIRWTEEATHWLKEIHDYIARDNPEAALRTVRGIYDKVQTLTSFPRRGYKHRSRSGRDLRVILYGHYRIAYAVNDDGDVTILGVFHGALDVDRFVP